MKVNVRDGLPCAFACVDDETVPAIGDSLLRGKLFGYGEEMPDQGFIVAAQHVD